MRIDPSYTYLLVNIGSVSIPFIFSFHPKLRFVQTWKAFFPAVIVTALFFVVWDVLFTSIGVWSFNDKYILGIKLWKIPIEEWLFFFCIPYASVFTYHCLKLLLNIEQPIKVGKSVSAVIIITITVVGFVYLTRLYTSVTFLLTSLFLMAHFAGNFPFTNLGRFYIVYAVLLIPFIITNGILTGSWIDEPVVLYNPNHIIGIRILTIPVEDTIYGLFLILLNVTLYEWLLTREKLKYATE